MPTRRRRSILPMRSIPLIGRERELQTLRALVVSREVQLVTFIGPGGVGTTRLAIELLHEDDLDVQQRAFFVDLAHIIDQQHVLDAVAAVVAPRQTARRAAITRLGSVLGDQRALLVLDNLEQIDGIGGPISTMLRVCPQLVIVATSRRPLQLRFEHVLPVPPLEVPGLARSARGHLAQPAASVHLFERRVRAVRPDFAVTEENAQVVAQICARLVGLPLAIELAASRIGILGPEAVLRQIEERQSRLEWRTADAPERHWSLHQTFDRSY